MRYYEIVLLIHPDQSAQVNAMITRYSNQVEAGAGKVHWVEDWGRLQLAYPIQKVHKAHYIMLNIECNQSVINELQEVFRFNDAIIRHLVMHVDGPMKESSAFYKDQIEKESKKERQNKTQEDKVVAEAASVSSN